MREEDDDTSSFKRWIAAKKRQEEGVKPFLCFVFRGVRFFLDTADAWRPTTLASPVNIAWFFDKINFCYMFDFFTN